MRASREVAEQIKDLVLSGSLAPGSRLPSERELVKQLHVGRAVVREALRILEVMGFAETQQGRGTFVTQSLPTIIDDGPELARRALREVAIHDVYEARLGIEPFIASLAAERRDTTLLAQLEATLDAFRVAATTGDVDAMVLADLDFHRCIGENARNRVLLRTLEVILDPAHHLSRITLRLPARAPVSVGQHERIFDSIRAGDPPASYQAMVDHLISAANTLRATAGANGWHWNVPSAISQLTSARQELSNAAVRGEERVHDSSAESRRTIGPWPRDLLPDALR